MSAIGVAGILAVLDLALFVYSNSCNGKGPSAGVAGIFTFLGGLIVMLVACGFAIFWLGQNWRMQCGLKSPLKRGGITGGERIDSKTIVSTMFLKTVKHGIAGGVIRDYTTGKNYQKSAVSGKDH